MREKLKRFVLNSSHNVYFFSILSAILLTLSFPKFDLSILIFFAFVPLFFLIREYENNILKIVKIGLIFGISHFVLLLYWIVYTLDKYGNIPWFIGIFLLLILSLYFSIYPTIFLLISAKLRAFSEASFSKGLLVGTLFVSTEYLRSTLLTGFPWGLVGYPLSSFPVMIQFADLLGIWGLSFFVITTNYYLFYTLSFYKSAMNNRPFAVNQFSFLIFFLLIISYNIYSYKWWKEYLTDRHNTGEDILTVALLQGNIPQELKEAREIEISLGVYERLLLESLAYRPQFVFYPETALPFYFAHDKEPTLRFLSVLSGVEREADWELAFVFGTFRVSSLFPHPRIHNSLLVWKKGEVVDLYDKEKLVPFGEYIPLGEYFPFLRRISVVSDIIKPGLSKNLRVDLDGKEVKFVPLICFESAFPQILVKRLRAKGDFVFVATNDAWFGRTSAPYQHFQMAIVRAVESRRYVLQSANTGITGIIDPLGKVRTKSLLEREEIVSGTIMLFDERTFFVEWGHLFPVFCTVFTAVIFLWCLSSDFRRGITKT